MLEGVERDLGFKVNIWFKYENIRLGRRNSKNKSRKVEKYNVFKGIIIFEFY